MTSQLPDQPQKSDTEKTLAALAWASVVLGVLGCVLIPQPFLNNTGFLLGVLGVAAGFAGLFGRLTWVPLGGMVLSGGAVVGTLYLQAHWADQLDNLF